MTAPKTFLEWLPVFIPALTSFMVMYYGFELQDKKDHDQQLLQEVKDIKVTINKTAIIFGQIQVEVSHLKEGQKKLENRVNNIEQTIRK